MAAVWTVSAFLTTILVPAMLFGLSAGIRAEIPAGTREAGAMRLWNLAPVHQRDLMLAAILIFDGAYRDALLLKEWTQLPPQVRASVIRTLAETRKPGEMYIGYIN